VRHRGAWLAVVLVALGGCGLEPQSAPEDITVDPVPRVTADPPEEFSAAQLHLWFLRGDRLARVARGGPRNAPEVALGLLAAGPDPDETAVGLTTAIAGDPFTVVDDDVDDGVLTVEATSAFVFVSGNDQTRAVAQVVWTLTELPEVDFIRFTSEDEPLEVSTDSGLSDQPVDRSDFASMAPPDGAPAPGPN
jgi:spore germination protein GerM